VDIQTEVLIIGGGAIIQSLATASNLGFLKVLSLQMDHVPWEGLHFYDLIWPLFMFIMGVAIPLSIASRRARGQAQVL
jgi:predicted acyltransferase